MPDTPKPKPTKRLRKRTDGHTAAPVGYVVEILSGGEWQRHDMDWLDEATAKELARANNWKVVDEDASAFPPKSNPDRAPAPEPEPEPE